MAPAQCSQQVVLLSVTLVVVATYIFYKKRKQSSTKSDTGGPTDAVGEGTKKEKTVLQPVDDNCSTNRASCSYNNSDIDSISKLKKICNNKSLVPSTTSTNTAAAAAATTTTASSTSVDSSEVVAAIEKVIRDIETSKAIKEESVLCEELEEKQFIDEKRKEIDKQKNHSSNEELYKQFLISSTSTPVKSKSGLINLADKSVSSIESSQIDTNRCIDLEYVTTDLINIDKLNPDQSSDVTWVGIQNNFSQDHDLYRSVELSPFSSSSTDSRINETIHTDDSSVQEEIKIIDTEVSSICDKTEENRLKNPHKTITDNWCDIVEMKITAEEPVSDIQCTMKQNNSNNKTINTTTNDTPSKRNKKLKKDNNKNLINQENSHTKDKKIINNMNKEASPKGKKSSIANKVSKENSNNNNTDTLPCSRVLEQKGHNLSTATTNQKNKSKMIHNINSNDINKTMTCNNDGGLEQKLTSLSLQDSSQHNDHSNNNDITDGGERDSANHSPAEVMLASPSMSNFSDAHSEGSSDSGKGCSDVLDGTTPPSQTPAGGSSVAGDLAPLVYEFIIPQHLVGRLIGRQGVFLHEIKSKTHTHIFIKRHPETAKLKICAIEGAPQDVESALEMIRQKFPMRRYPNLTLEKVSFVNVIPPLCPLQGEHFQLQLIGGVNNDVILSSLITAGHFFLQQPTHPSYQSLNQLNMCMNTLYNTPEAPPLDTPLKDAVCAAPAMGGWYRAQIIEIDEENKTVDVRFLDYGGFLTLETSQLRKIRADLMMLPFQAVECLLANVLPAGDDNEWTEDARLFVQNMACNQILQAQILDYTEQGIPLVFLYAMYCGQVVVVNQELINQGYAKCYTTPVAAEELS